MKLPTLINFLNSVVQAYAKEDIDVNKVDVLFGLEGEGYDITHYAVMRDENDVKDPRVVFALALFEDEEEAE